MSDSGRKESKKEDGTTDVVVYATARLGLMNCMASSNEPKRAVIVSRNAKTQKMLSRAIVDVESNKG